MTAMRSPRNIASLRSCVMNTIVRPSSRCSSTSCSCISRRMSGSSAEKASSMSRMPVPAVSARAMPTRWRMPPESSSGIASARSPSPTRSRISMARARRSVLPTPWISSAYAALSSTVRWGSRAKCWKTIDTDSRRIARNWVGEAAVTLRPSTSTSPVVGVSRPLSMRMMVDFPEPDRPMMTKISPRFTVKLASITAAVPASATSARVWPARRRRTASLGARPKTLKRFRASRTGRAGASVTEHLGSPVHRLHRSRPGGGHWRTRAHGCGHRIHAKAADHTVAGQVPQSTSGGRGLVW